MGRVLLKGGTWKNTEDEILKVAVMKYGKNQWARISSLLVRKTPKQCKARWYEWIDPSIKKTEWTKEEEEKLLHLAKVMPSQWRTIAPIIGRTPAQCLEHYEKLLDEAQGGADGSSASLLEAKKLRPGEIDPAPDTKPARPDPIDMDEDEKEMLSEARARLANTQGKKAKRKAREKQLDEARRLAALAKKRDLRAAGIVIEKKIKGQKYRTMDYNSEIPFEKRPPPGFYDGSVELSKSTDPELKEAKFQNTDNQRKEKEEELRKKDLAKQKKRKEAGMPSLAIQKAFLEQEARSKRSKLLLPPPMLSDQELEQIVKLGSAGELATAIAEESETAASSKLTAEYTTMNTPLRTPSRKGIGSAMVGSTPLSSVRRITNSTPVSGATPSESPFYDPYKINGDTLSGTIGDEASRLVKIKKDLAIAFQNLPAPKNDFELVLPDFSDDKEIETDYAHVTSSTTA